MCETMRSKTRSVAGSRRAFTLIELLVVVAIIAILLSILLPSLERARAQARQLLGLTNLRSQGQSMQMYAERNNGYFARGIQGGGIPDFDARSRSHINPDLDGDRRTPPRREYAIYATAALNALDFPGATVDNRVIQDTIDLWRSRRGAFPSPQYQFFLREILKGPYGQQLQCPDFPEENPNPNDPMLSNGGTGRRVPRGQYNDYVANAIAQDDHGYTQKNIDFDGDGGSNTGDPDDSEFQGVSADDADYDAVATATQIEIAGKSLSEIIYVTEGHRSLYWSDYRFHHFFLTSHLPFGRRPRIANDQRHPGGLNAVFFDGHAKTMTLRQIDPGWPNSLGIRLRWFAAVPPQYY